MSHGSATDYVPTSDPEKLTRRQLIHMVHQHRQRIASLTQMLDERPTLTASPPPLTKAPRAIWGVCEDCGRKRVSADRELKRRAKKAKAKTSEVPGPRSLKE